MISRTSGRGSHIDFAAPGVDIWTAASVKGARTRTGTSFATPFVSAAAALVLQQQPELHGEDVMRVLAETSNDLGQPGRDDIYGHGVPQMDRFCQTVAPLLPASASE